MVRIVSHAKDEFAVNAMRILEKRGYPVRLLQNGGFAGKNEVAIFSVQHGEVHFPSKHCRMAAHRLLEAGIVPEWATTTPYVVALRSHPSPRVKKGLEEAVRNIGEAYSRWFAGVKGCACPWGCEPTDPAHRSTFEGWKKKTIAGSDENQSTRTFFTYLTPLGIKDMQQTTLKFQNNPEVLAVSAFCFHANEARTAIVPSFDLEMQRALVNFLESLPGNDFHVYTFHPDDMEILAKWGLQDTVLSSIWGDKEAFLRQWELSRDLLSKLTKTVNLYPIRDLFQDDELVRSALSEAKRRSDRMFRRIKKNPPPIFRLLTEEEQRTRLAQEAVMYLLMSKRYGQLPAVYVGLEVHSEYWKSGELNWWGNSHLPVSMAPDCLRQHWGNWAMTSARKDELSRLALL